MNTIFKRGGQMKRSKIMPFVLLFIFLSFLITQYPGGHVKALALDESKAITMSEMAESFLFKDDPKKYAFTRESGSVAVPGLAIILFLYSIMHITARRKEIFYTPIFYQANYVIHTP